jgi:antitoxin component of MazEF toxin-antitoxin module
MPLTAEGKIIKVGNSSAVILPKIVFDNYHIEQGNMLKIVMTENGLFIPAKQNESAFIQKELENALKSLSGKGNKK